METNPNIYNMTKYIKDNKLSDVIKISKFIQYEESYTIDIVIESIPYTMVTNFDNYCYFESEIINSDNINILFFDNVQNSYNNIIDKLKNISKNKETPKIIINDTFYLHQKINKKSKVFIDYNLLETHHKLHHKSNIKFDISKFPKELILTSHQIFQLIVNEIKSFNGNMTFNHYLEPMNNNICELKLVCFLDNKKMESNVMEIKINLESSLYPFIPPKLEIIKPYVKSQLFNSIVNLPILKLENWNSTISLEWLLLKIIEQIDPIINDYINVNTNVIDLNVLLMKLSLLTNQNNNELMLINIPIPKKMVENKDEKDKYWKSGTGYGYGSNATKSWDISTYIKEQEYKNLECKQLLKEISQVISDDHLDTIFTSFLPQYILNSVKSLTLLELDKNNNMYVEIINILNKMSKNKLFFENKKFINDLHNSFATLYNDLKSFFEINSQKNLNDLYLSFFCFAELINSNIKVETKINETITLDIKKEYENIMKPLQSNYYTIPDNHRFVDYKKQKPESKSIARMVSEISSLKSGLPLNWESSIWIRLSKNNINIFSFFISGPKDTPYENGIFEFHTAFPSNYPQSEPKVLLNTTGGGSIRFNPNLYNCGKVCLSLLGTWSGQESEKWNPKTSTFLQVLVSIQSLIFVESPFFNEPGYERDMHTEKGKKKSKEYNEPLQIGTIRWAINNMIKNPPDGMDDVIKLHFKMKKEEILERTNQWLSVISSVNKQSLENEINEMKQLFATL